MRYRTRSYASLVEMEGGAWRDMNLPSLGGIPLKPKDKEALAIPQSIVQYLAENPHTASVHIHFDNDGPGFAAADAVAIALYDIYEVAIELPECGKDLNECLLQVRAEAEPKELRRDVGKAR